MQALRPSHGDLVPLRLWHKAERRLLRLLAVPLPVEVHLPAKLAAPAGILARHVVDGLSRAQIQRRHRLAAVRHRDDPEPVPGVCAATSSSKGEVSAAGGGEGVAERGEDEGEEHEDGEEEGGGDQIQEPPLPLPACPPRFPGAGMLTWPIVSAEGSECGSGKEGRRWFCWVLSYLINFY